jgi:hypothetical protein
LEAIQRAKVRDRDAFFSGRREPATRSEPGKSGGGAYGFPPHEDQRLVQDISQNIHSM